MLAAILDPNRVGRKVGSLGWAQVCGCSRTLEHIRSRRDPGSVSESPAFIAIGGTPQTDSAERLSLDRDQAGYLLTGPDLVERNRRPAGWPLERAPYALEASVLGVFVAGNVRHGSPKRVAAAVGEGATAVAQIHPYLTERQAADS